MGVVQVRPMPAYKITDLHLDADLSEYKGAEYSSVIEKWWGTIDKIFIVDDEEELVDAVSDHTGFCVNSIKYEQVSSVEVTVYGLFCGETNTIDKRVEIPILGKKSDLAIIRAVKSELGWNNIRCIKHEYGDSIRLEPSGVLQFADIEVVY
jgi:hypothetical protein